MKKSMKQLSAIILSAMCILLLSTPAFAAETSSSDSAAPTDVQVGDLIPLVDDETGELLTFMQVTEVYTEIAPYATYPYSAVILGDGVRLRKEPNTSSTILGLLYKGTKVTVTGNSGTWYKVKVNSTSATGYVSWQYVGNYA